MTGNIPACKANLNDIINRKTRQLILALYCIKIRAYHKRVLRNSQASYFSWLESHLNMTRKSVLKQFGGGPRFESGRSQPDFFCFFLFGCHAYINTTLLCLYSFSDHRQYFIYHDIKQYAT